MATTTVSAKKATALSPGFIAAIVIALLGIAAWIYQLAVGMQTTGLGQQVVWGLYIAAFFTALGAGATVLVLTGVSEFTPIVPATSRGRNLSLALACFVIGALLITMDVGQPIQLWRIITAFRFTSLMTWDFWLLVVAGIIALVYLVAAKSAAAQKTMGVLGIIAGVAVVAVEAWMLATMAARPEWGSGLTLICFLVGAAVAGMSVSLVAGTAPEKLHSWLYLALWLNLVVVLAEVLTGLVGNSEETGLVLAGFAAPLFWLQLIVGLLVPLALLMRKSTLWLAGTLAVFGVVLEKLWELTVGQAKSWVGLPQGSYLPTWVELLAVIGMVALGIVVYRVVMMVFKTE